MSLITILNRNVVWMFTLLCSTAVYAVPFQDGVPTTITQASASISVIADVDGDNISDLVVSSQATNAVYVYIGDGAGGYGAPTVLSVGAGSVPSDVAVGDVTGDGRADIVTSNWGLDSISIFAGLPAGGFATAATRGTGVKPMALALADLSGDGVLDIVIANNGATTITIYYSDQASVLSFPVQVGAGPADIAIADMDGDTKLDIVVANRNGNNTVSVLMNSGRLDPDFGAPVWFSVSSNPIAVGNDPYSVAVGDLDNNGVMDIVTSNRLDNSVSVLYSSGRFTYLAAQRLPVGIAPKQVAVGDVNGDSKLDIVTANYGDQVWANASLYPSDGDATVLLGTGLGTFNRTAPIQVGSTVASVALGHVDGDTQLDLAATDSAGGVVKVFNLKPRFQPQLSWANINKYKSMKSIIWTGSQFVAVDGGIPSSVFTSPDGQNWAKQYFPGSSAHVHTVAWNGDQFVAIGMRSSYTSPDAVNWTAHPRATADIIYSISWSGSQFVAVGSNTSILTSPDGITWTTQPTNFPATVSGQSRTLYSVVWSGSQFVAVGKYFDVSVTPMIATPILLTSPDGIIWSSPQLPAAVNTLSSVVWNGTRFVASGSAGEIISSTDGVNWNKRISGVTQDLSGIHWNGSQFLIAVSNGQQLTSSDGIGWQLDATVNNVFFRAWDGLKYVGVDSRGVIKSSVDGVTWLDLTTLADLGTTLASDVVFGKDLYVAVGYSIRISSDAQSWSVVRGSVNLISICWSGREFVAVGYSGEILTSPDGRAWTTRASNTTEHLYSVAWNGSQFIAVGGTGVILSSPDGITWTQQSAGLTTASLNSVIWAGSQFVAVGSSSTILTSPDGSLWTQQSSGVINPSNWLESVAWSGTKFVAVSHSSGISLTSTDGTNWSEVVLVGSFLSIAWSGSEFVAVGIGIYSSPDAITWTKKSEEYVLNGVSWTGTRFATVGSPGLILSSPTAAAAIAPISPVSLAWAEDLDGDAVLNASDRFPNDVAASIDRDGDGVPDEWNAGKTVADSTTGLKLDVFPNDAAASEDSDSDGSPEAWNTGKTVADSTTGLVLDAFPNDISAANDTDGDGFPDAWNTGKTVADSTTGLLLDAFPLDSARWTSATVASAHISINAASFRTGDTITVYRAFSAAAVPANADLYAALILPDGTLFTMQPQFAGFNAAIAPLQANVAVPNVTGAVFSYTFTGTEPVGTYIWKIGIADSGTYNFNNSIVSLPFSFAP